MNPDEYSALTATQIAKGVREGRWSAREMVEAALARIAALDPTIGAMTTVRSGEALSEAAAVDHDDRARSGALAGVPIVVKEEFDVAGCVTTLGGRGNSTPRGADSEVIRRMRAAGAVIVGKTAMPEFGQVPLTETRDGVITRNPFDHARTIGGSSGGSAAAVASGMVPIALGADGGGSIRIPAACAGLVGFKPQRGLVTLAPHSEHWFGLVVAGGMSRTVADSAVLYDVISGSMPTDRWQAAAPVTPFAAEAAKDPAPLRIAWTTRSITPGLRTDPVVQEATKGVVDTLAGAGHRVAKTDARWPTPTDSFLIQFFAGMATEAATVEHYARLQRQTRISARIGRPIPGRAVKWAERRGERIATAVEERFFAHADVVVLPTLTTPAPPAGQLTGAGYLRSQWHTLPVVANTALFNVTGHAVMQVPAGTDDRGVPLGVQLVARKGDEGILFALAAQLERARPFPKSPILT
ncbi:amidase family protein [Janibacter sp. GXQ6167]|uniref:amidase family protein n=1 Tax=Janibacter sp. GXQ6167 TaxID=3240791 RepID=UPI0035252EA7